jgi:hypothetical protein
VFTEDWSILHDLDNYYVGQNNSALFLVDTLFQAAHRAGLKTAAVGKSGPAYLQDYREDGTGGVILDENMAFPKSFATALLGAGLPFPPIPRTFPTTVASSRSMPATATRRDDQCASSPWADGVTSDPRATASGSPHNAKNEYMMGIYTSYILPQLSARPQPDLVPQSGQHRAHLRPGLARLCGLALQDQDKLLGQLQAKLTRAGPGHVDGPHRGVRPRPQPGRRRSRLLPAAWNRLRAGRWRGRSGAIDPQGYSVSGDVRTADLLTRAGFAHVYDGVGCTRDPVMSGIKANGDPLYPVQTDDAAGSTCGKGANYKYTTGAFSGASTLPADAVVIAANGGSDYLYVPSHDPALVTSVVTALQQRKAIRRHLRAQRLRHGAGNDVA